MKLTENRRLLLKAATLYYQNGLTQAQIGKKLNFSRPVVSKLLQQAREQGIVEVFIKEENAQAVALGIQLEQKYQLEEVIVTPSHAAASKQEIKTQVARMTANYLVNQLPNLSSIGLTWGTTLAEVIEEMPFVSYPETRVVPMVGGVSGEHLFFDTNHLAFRLAEKLQGKCRYFYAPAIAESQAFASVLQATQLVKSAKEAALAVDLALVGAGNPQEHSTWIRLGYMEAGEMQESLEAGVVGDVSASLFDEQGQTVSTPFQKKLIGVTVEEFAKIKKVLVVASGVEKTPSIRGLLNGGRCHILVVDEFLAKSLLREEVKSKQ